ncbi:hypothetical protein NZD89_23185 [Alicyclobacillus fastidiosus]|uniref:DUF2642 domain-containing protein n=1 Tax=Alicyclobacillus fastidiosus TaxID=392011 RepID=A0ABY6ZEI2_9BACL|nr:hypothetical protein [Alicyclobacillus fastidiosus]WAH41140.1 hypothetical protein NZD89_23185 [Alicyclobacillus fastidiosus]GMA62702.1 hypothetical protein GCM10025859_31420 [Alicyclobacillus fastidiosus]
MSGDWRKHEHRKRDKVILFTNDGNEISGTLEALEDGLVKLRHVTVRKDGKRRLTTSTLFVVLDKIDSFHRQTSDHHHDCGCDESDIEQEEVIASESTSDLVLED